MGTRIMHSYRFWIDRSMIHHRPSKNERLFQIQIFSNLLYDINPNLMQIIHSCRLHFNLKFV